MEAILVDHFIEWFLRIIGQAGHTITKERLKDQITELALDVTEEALEEKLLPKDDTKAEVKPSRIFKN